MPQFIVGSSRQLTLQLLLYAILCLTVRSESKGGTTTLAGDH